MSETPVVVAPLSTANLVRAMRAVAFDSCDELWWRIGANVKDEQTGQWGPRPGDDHLHLFAQCSDVFDWGTSDVEELTDANIDLFEASVAEARATEPMDEWKGVALFCARVRGQRPQNAYLTKVVADNKELLALFLAAGPPREVNFLNPGKPVTEAGA